ncbi:hypothetical protein ACI2L1_43745 [Streptomyces sp. NPDC019531]|uniref:hypothetical protein n=1 Tax=Streptomyces sp. NPDC019531 TaxID=3365062 RepID=UPI00384C25A0
MNATTTVRAAATTLVAGLALLTSTGCSLVAQDPVRAPAPSGTGDVSTAAPSSAGAIRKAWLSCMHDAGHTELRLTDAAIVMPAAGAGTADDAAAARKAKARKDDALKCDAKVPGMRQLRQKSVTGDMKAARGLAACLRENGLPRVADPKPGTGAVLTVPKDVEAAVWDKAVAICGKKYPQVPFAAIPAR